ncbi:hypothetical protein HELRODRAFT_171338 [Helobdella robusta]|uniref:Uncharacterized protein n=1 Tax=Helobdella robusta TaxID=6412 RepID=T1F449_HELRO|nr:hypothetical protein HELRODRAFT_171338 [Helobdella robusta]ESO05678.1 hypothetical protein HELRODRAFT_171338 [Helobdella robusta]
MNMDIILPSKKKMSLEHDLPRPTTNQLLFMYVWKHTRFKCVHVKNMNAGDDQKEIFQNSDFRVRLIEILRKSSKYFKRFQSTSKVLKIFKNTPKHFETYGNTSSSIRLHGHMFDVFAGMTKFKQDVAELFREHLFIQNVTTTKHSTKPNG